jgi:hypothetical protein
MEFGIQENRRILIDTGCFPSLALRRNVFVFTDA